MLTFVLLGAAVLFSIALSFSQSDKAMILEDPPSSTAEPLTAIWVVAGLVLLALVIAALRPRPRVMRAVILGLAVPVVVVAVFSTVEVQDLSSSGFIDSALAGQRRAQALRSQAFTVCGGAAIEEASPPSEPYRLLVLDEEGQGFAPDASDAHGWTARSLSDLQIVVCVGSEHEDTNTATTRRGLVRAHLLRPGGTRHRGADGWFARRHRAVRRRDRGLFLVGLRRSSRRGGRPRRPPTRWSSTSRAYSKTCRQRAAADRSATTAEASRRGRSMPHPPSRDFVAQATWCDG